MRRPNSKCEFRFETTNRGAGSVHCSNNSQTMLTSSNCHAKNEFFNLDDQEKQETAEQQPCPNPIRYCFSIEQVLEWWRVGEQELQDHHSTNPKQEIWIASMCRK